MSDFIESEAEESDEELFERSVGEQKTPQKHSEDNDGKISQWVICKLHLVAFVTLWYLYLKAILAS